MITMIITALVYIALTVLVFNTVCFTIGVALDFAAFNKKENEKK